MDRGDYINILLVDDKPENILSLEAVLDHPDYRLVRAGSGEEALARALEDDFAVILLDAHMPGLDGFETASLIRGRDKSKYTPIIFITAVSKDDREVRRGYALGAVDYIFKPFIPEILKAKVAFFSELYQKTVALKQQAEQLKRDLEYLDRYSRPPAPVTANLFSSPNLQTSAPEEFASLVEQFGTTLDQAIQQQLYKVEYDTSAQLKRQAQNLGFLRAGPRDVVELHAAALKGKTSGLSPLKARYYIEEGKTLLIELMGFLAAYYRLMAPTTLRGGGARIMEIDQQGKEGSYEQHNA